MGERYSTPSPLLQELSAYTLPDPPVWPNADHLAGQSGPARHVPAQHVPAQQISAQNLPAQHPQAQPILAPHIPKKRGPYKTKDKSLKAARISPENRVVGRGGMVSLGHSKEVTDMLKAQAEAQAQASSQAQVQTPVQTQLQAQVQLQPQAPAQPRNEEVQKEVETKLDTPLLTDTTSIDENKNEPMDRGAVLPPCPFTNQTGTATVQEQGDVSMVGKTADGREKGKGRAVQM
ncbi:uncharacterized protein J4E79_009774 [Alternaria viburni]|uniref:uncharacterized protein n=1 Tax=Alternaria viburni TaxID=566460 RepID=UPI0020C1F24A|nr:uncharacterized protein J4E79_009774 [Alternaria viburni]KAI4649927.1 hypothetical protein J4E79_009774 [Alternaria viburni]